MISKKKSFIIQIDRWQENKAHQNKFKKLNLNLFSNKEIQNLLTELDLTVQIKSISSFNAIAKSLHENIEFNEETFDQNL